MVLFVILLRFDVFNVFEKLWKSWKSYTKKNEKFWTSNILILLTFSNKIAVIAKTKFTNILTLGQNFVFRGFEMKSTQWISLGTLSYFFHYHLNCVSEKQTHFEIVHKWSFSKNRKARPASLIKQNQQHERRIDFNTFEGKYDQPVNHRCDEHGYHEGVKKPLPCWSLFI